MNTYRGAHYFATNRFPFHIERCPIRRKEHIAAHTHDFVELVYVVSGNATHEMSGQRYDISAGDVFVVEPQVPHSYHGADRDDTCVYNVLFNLDLLGPELQAVQQLPSFLDLFYLSPFMRKDARFIPYLRLDPIQRIPFEGNLAIILREYKEKPEGFPLVVKTRLIECLVLLSRYHRVNASGSASPADDQARIKAIVRFVDQHYAQPVTLAQLSDACGMSVSSFTAKFKAETGLSLMDYKQSVQVAKAGSLLRSSDRKVLDIAHEVGFQDISFFNRVFKKHTGMNPRDYRKRS